MRGATENTYTVVIKYCDSTRQILSLCGSQPLWLKMCHYILYLVWIISRQISGWWDQCVQILRFRAEVALFASLFALNLAWQIAHSAKTGASGSLDFPYFYVPTRISPLGTSAFWEFFLNFTEVYFFWKCQKNRAITSSVFLRDYEGSKKNNFLPFLIFLTKLLVTGWPNFTQFLTSVLPTNLILYFFL